MNSPSLINQKLPLILYLKYSGSENTYNLEFLSLPKENYLLNTELDKKEDIKYSNYQTLKKI